MSQYVSPADLRQMRDNGHPCLIVDAADWCIVYASPLLEHSLGYQRGALVTKPLDDLIPLDKTSAHKKHVADYIKDPTTRAMGVSSGPMPLDVKARNKDGSLQPVTIGLYPEFYGGAWFVVATVLFRVE